MSIIPTGCSDDAGSLISATACVCSSILVKSDSCFGQIPGETCEAEERVFLLRVYLLAALSGFVFWIWAVDDTAGHQTAAILQTECLFQDAEVTQSSIRADESCKKNRRTGRAAAY
jgi:hypothetical protein